MTYPIPGRIDPTADIKPESDRLLGLEEKLQAVPAKSLREQVAFIVSAIGRGMLTGVEARSERLHGLRKRASRSPGPPKF